MSINTQYVAHVANKTTTWKPNFLCVALLALKPIADMFPTLQIADMLLTSLALALLVFGLKTKIALRGIDAFLIMHLFLVTLSFLRSPQGNVFVFIKVVSHYLLYFIGRLYFKSVIGSMQIICKAFMIVVVVNMMLFIFNLGRSSWGNALTFRGTYFFKYDLSLAMIQGLIFWSYTKQSLKRKLFERTFMLIAAFMVLFSNSRSGLLMLTSFAYMYFMYRREIRTGKTVRFTPKFIIISLLVFFVALWLYTSLLKTSYFQRLSFLSFDTDNFFGAANTQGRSEIWAFLGKKFGQSSLFDKLFGIGFTGDTYISWNGTIYDSHNFIIKILYLSGIFGLLLYASFYILIFRNLRLCAMRSVKYLMVSLLLLNIIGGLTTNVIVFTQQTWLQMVFTGAVMSLKTAGSHSKLVEQSPSWKE